jgi:uracil-DNA glycosylase
MRSKFMPVDTALVSLNDRITACRLCPRLVDYREQVARGKRRAFRDEIYWGRPLPGWGDVQARILIVGLAPAAHGANRTGRMFTGDRSGDFLYGALFRAGFANQPVARALNDGLELSNVYITSAARCAPPGNKPTPAELANCLPYLQAELDLLPKIAVLLALGKTGFDACLRALGENGLDLPKPRPQFGHAVQYQVGKYRLVGSYHPSQRNTQTGLLTPEMMDEALALCQL